MATRDSSDPLYSIRIAARLVGLHVQTLRYYERSGLIRPARSTGNVRYYSERDVEMIRRIKSLVDDLGVNLAGVEVILRMNEQMAQMETTIRALEERLAEMTGRRYLTQGRPDLDGSEETRKDTAR
jgi:MerR family transcriptional regulator/heat shock protein HspR